MTTQNTDLIHLLDALKELNTQRLKNNPSAICYAASTAYGFASSGRIPTERRGRGYFIRREDLPLIAARLPLGGPRSVPSVA